MTDALPHGLVSHTDCVSSDLESADRVDIEDVAKLWRVYTTNKITLKQGSGQRLENLFWRIWSNGRISSNITGSKLARLFIQMADESPLWVRSRRELASISRNSPRFPLVTSARRSPSLATSKDSSGGCLSRNGPGSGSQANLPPSILKKPSRSPSQNPRKSARFASAGLEDGENQSDRSKTFRSSASVAESKHDEHISPRTKSSAANAGSTRAQRGPANKQVMAVSDNAIFNGTTSCFQDINFDEGTPASPKKPIPEDFSPKTTKDSEMFKHALTSHPPTPPRSHTYCSLPDAPLTPTSPESTVSEATPSQPKPIESTPTPSLVEKDFRVRFIQRQSHGSRISSLTSLISSEEPLSLSISPTSTKPTTFTSTPATQNSQLADSSHPEVSNLPPEVMLSRTLSSSSSIPIASRGSSSLRPATRQEPVSQLSKLIEEEKRTKPKNKKKKKATTTTSTTMNET
ncbi:hypothetical protein PRK78_001408 [Emydomyces testavorans]|uniref:Nitrogen regulatory protein areA GATA-like domain-containing protein n=1 Tax=Emydomyces testavorans TaxID=2070801 RepID=A0AAF0DCX2_9EURO|nr:hypothetical protein PRK78_001408 [Emydomyces testavorans]